MRMKILAVNRHKKKLQLPLFATTTKISWMAYDPHKKWKHGRPNFLPKSRLHVAPPQNLRRRPLPTRIITKDLPPATRLRRHHVTTMFVAEDAEGSMVSDTFVLVVTTGFAPPALGAIVVGWPTLLELKLSHAGLPHIPLWVCPKHRV